MTPSPLGEVRVARKEAERGKHSLQGSESGRGEGMKERPLFQR